MNQLVDEMAMLTHNQIWAAIDTIASRSDISVSGLAKKAGLDPTTFNKSKRLTNDGRKRWPSTESVSKVLKATDTPLEDFVHIVLQFGNQDDSHPTTVSNDNKYGFAEEGQPTLSNSMPQVDDLKNLITVSEFGSYMEPLYRQGDTLLVKITKSPKKGDRVVVHLNDGSHIPGVLKVKNKSQIELSSLNPEMDNIHITQSDIKWVANIVWVSQ